MFFHVEERRIWLRTHTHTAVSDRDPDFPRFVQEPNGRVARMLRRVYRALRRDGVVRFNFAADGNCSHFLAVVRKAMALPAYHSRFDSFDWPWSMPTLAQYEDVMHQSGFRDIRVTLENADHSFADAEAMVRWVEQPSLVPFLGHLDGPHRQAFRDFVVEQMVEQTMQQDGRCFETFRRIDVFARK